MTKKKLDMAIRSTGVGASESPAVVGLSPWQNALDVWMVKVGVVEVEQTPAMEWGNRLEGAVLQKYSDVMGLKVESPGETLRHPKHDHILATPDAFADNHIVEIKTTTSDKDWGAPGTDEVPLHYMVQVTQQMSVCDVDRCDIAVLNLKRRSFRIYHINRDTEIERLLTHRVTKFWNEHVLKGVAPESDNEDSTFRLFCQVHPADNGEIVEPSAKAKALVEQYRDTKLKAAQYKDAVDHIARQIKTELEDSSGFEGFELEDGSTAKVSWKKAKGSKRVDWQAVARAMGATPEVIAENTKESRGGRRFRVTLKENE
tara:strand:- start:2565 stop:3509 length:945 start_codon:yes stop_codon:yes gene_type:complete